MTSPQGTPGGPPPPTVGHETLQADGVGPVGAEHDSEPAKRDESFPRACRLTAEAQFRELLARGFRVCTPHLVIHVLANRIGHSRLGLTIPRKVGTAVVRNRIRRRLREAFRRSWRFAIEDHPADIVVRVLPDAARASFQILEREGTSALGRWREHGFRAGGRRRSGGSR